LNDDALNKLKELFAEMTVKFEVIRTEYQTQAKLHLMEYIKVFLDLNSEIKTIRWVQYTPYFNDGEDCYFGVRDAYCSNVTDPLLLTPYGELEEESEEFWSTDGGWKEDIVPDSVFESTKQLNTMIQSIPEEVMKELFGDHSEITITKEGIQIEGYVHE